MPRDRTFRFVMYSLVAVGVALLLLREFLG